MRPSDLPIEDLLLQLNEESAELVQATAKSIRKLRGNNPTPLTDDECLAAMLEEIADVEVSSEALMYSLGMRPDALVPMKQKKRDRWLERLDE